jgi:hypothetical protein
MSTINKHIAIPKNVSSADDLDFHFLKKKGIEYIEEFGGQLWTDYNSHDPGITMLEMLSYAITDLGMRINLPIENILATKNSAEGINSQFYKASEIFPTKSVTALDYRKLFIDIKGVKNCWLKAFEKTVYADCKQDLISYNSDEFNETHDDFKRNFKLKGLYDILVDFDDLEDGLTKNDVIKSIKIAYHKNRNLCEDLINITEVETQAISVCTSIEVEANADEELINAQILFEIENYFSPSLKFYSIKDMIDRGYTTDQIFDGPILNNGFIDTEELKNTELKREVRLSDLMKIIMNIDGVKLIKDISIGHCDESKSLDNEWNICIDDDKKPVLCENSVFNFSKGVLPLNINELQVEKYLKELIEAQQEEQDKAKENLKLKIPNGRFSDVESYTTIQNDFPDTYGIGQEGIISRATTERKSKAKQLKAYLLFFDQLLASYFQHLGKVKDLLSINNSQVKTFFTQAVKDIKGFDDLVTNYPMSDDSSLSDTLFEKFDSNIQRRNELLDHLLARFAERFGEYSFIMKTIYGSATDEIILKNKELFLRDYIDISAQRGCAFNYVGQKPEKLWNTNNVSGFQKRIAGLMGIKNYNRRNLSSSFIEIYESAKVKKPIGYRWRITKPNGDIILSATTTYPDESQAKKEMYFAVLQIIQTEEKDVEKAFEIGVKNDSVIGNFCIHISVSGKMTFNVVNLDYPATDKDYIIAKQFKSFIKFIDLKNAILDVISFMKYEFTEEGLFLVEHMLLRPDVNINTQNQAIYMPICTDNCEKTCSIDPYSYKVSIVLPGYTLRFSNPDFRNYMERIIKAELPAHILPKICWVGDRKNPKSKVYNDLVEFEESYKTYLIKKTNLEQTQPELSLIALLKSMSKLNTIYPTGSLIDCEDESDDVEGKIILGQTILGTL